MIQTHIRDFRKMRDMTLKQLADAIGTTPQSVQRLETGNMTVSLEWLYKIGNALQVEPYKLLIPTGNTPVGEQFAEMTRGALIANRRTIAIGDVPLEMGVAYGKLIDLVILYSKGLAGFDDIPEAAAKVAAAASRIGIDGRALREAAKLGEAA